MSGYEPTDQPQPPQAQPPQAPQTQAYGGAAAYGTAPAQVPPAAPGAALAVVSLSAGIATVLIGSLFVLILPSLYRGGYDVFALVNVVQIANGGLTLLLGLVAVVTGVVALLRKGPRGRARAGGGIALGAAALASVVVTLLQTVLFQFL